jgi:uncharacterized protein
VSLRIDQDHARFRNIVRGKIRENLRRYVSQGEMMGKQGKDIVSIPVPYIDIPRFRFNDRQSGGVAQGDGEPGDAVGRAQPGQGQGGPGQAGRDPAEHALEVELSLDELAEILGEELELPNIENKGKSRIVQKRDRYVDIRRVGPNSLRHFKRTFRSALRRQLSMGTYDAKRPIIIPTREDFRYRSFRTELEPVANAVIIYMMDVSGSMGDEQKEIVRIESFWIDTWLRKQYEGVETRFIIHDATAREVDRDTFFRTRESGGTMISSAYELCAKILEADYPASEWNIYPYHFSDGDNWSVDDTHLCVRLLRDHILPVSNAFGYGQVNSPYGSGQFLKDLREHFPGEEKMIVSEIRDREAIIESIREFLGKGH